jgi:hypothetical protein
MRVFPGPEDPVTAFLRMQGEGLGLLLLQDKLGPQASREDALKMHRKLRQQGRAPSRCVSDDA